MWKTKFLSVAYRNFSTDVQIQNGVIKSSYEKHCDENSGPIQIIHCKNEQINSVAQDMKLANKTIKNFHPKV